MSNQKFADVRAFLRSVRAQGEKEGLGQAARAEFLIDLATACAEGHVTDTQEDARKVWGAYREAASKKSTDEVESESSHKQRVSSVLQVMKAACIPGVNLSDSLLDARKFLAEEKKKGTTKSNTFEAFVSVARAQKKKGSVDLTADEVRAALLPKGKDAADRTELTEYEKLLKAALVIRDGTKGTESSLPKEAFPSDTISAIVELCEERIGLLRLNTLKAKQEAAAAAVAVRMAGFASRK